MRHAALALAVVVAACGYTDPGSGTHTLKVKVTVIYHAGAANSMTAQVSVIDKHGDPVSNAKVKLKDGENSDSFTAKESDCGGDGTYCFEESGYSRRLELTVQRGSDGLTAKLEGPGEFVITKPANGSQVDKSSLDGKLDVRWKTDDGIAADEVVIVVDDDEYSTSHDTGKYDDISESDLSNGGTNLSITRQNHVELAGGRPGSKFTLGYRVENGITISD